ncbi:MAG TPA: glycoside hydrolase N-terminal domain-containing protein, partial [Pseudonocardiaceae bacterium]
MTPDDLVLAWPAPAANWFEAAPVGNGRLGAMVFGGTDRARLQINDATVWSGTPYGPADALAAVVGAGADPDRLAEIRAAIRAEDYRRAEALLMTFEGDYTQEYLPWADLWLSLDGDGAYHGRTLNLDNGVVTEEIQFGDRFVTRTTWASRPASAVCVAITVRGGTVDLGLNLTSPLHVVQRRVRADGLILGIEIP